MRGEGSDLGGEPGSDRPRGAGRTAALVSAIVLGALLAVAFRGPLSGRLFYLRDVTQNHYPVRQVVTERLLEGALPLWDPYHGGGTPLLANPDNLVLHPISALFLLLPFDAAFTASILLHFLLLAWGGYLLARALPVGRPAAALAAATLALSGPVASLASLQNVLGGAAFVPMALWAWLSGLAPGRRFFLAIAAGLFGVVLLTAEPASVLAFLVLAAVLGLTRAEAPRAGRPAGRVLTSLLLVLFLAAGLAAAQILPARDLLALSARGAGFAAAEGMKWSLEPARALEMILPRLFGDPTRLSPESWWGLFLFEGGFPFLLSVYLGAIPCLLALLGIGAGGGNARRGRGLAAAAAFFLLLALGRHAILYRLLYDTIPMLRRIRYPERFVVAALFALALLAALGLDRLLDRSRPLRESFAWLLLPAGLAFVAVTLLAAAPGIADALLVRAARVPEAVMKTETGAVLRGAVLRSGLWMFGEALALALGAALAARASWSKARPLAAWGIVAISGLSQTAAAAPALSTVAPGWLKAPSPLAAEIARGPAAPRLHHDPRPAGLSVWGTTDELAWGYRFDRFTYALESGHADRVPTILDEATDRMDLAEQASLAHSLMSLPLGERLKILAICHAGLLLSFEALDHPGLQPGPVLQGLSRPSLKLYRLRSILPRARFVTRAVPPAHPDDLARSLADPGFDPERMVLIEGVSEDGEAVGGAGGGTGEGRVALAEDRPERLRILVEAQASGYLVLSDAWAPGWRATVDGAPAGLLRANGLFRAVRLLAGSHEVVMTYRPESVAAGFATSLFALVLVLAWGAFARRRRL